MAGQRVRTAQQRNTRKRMPGGGGGMGSRESDEQNRRKGTFTTERENGSVRETNARNARAKYEGGREWGWKMGRSTGKGTDTGRIV